VGKTNIKRATCAPQVKRLSDRPRTELKKLKTCGRIQDHFVLVVVTGRHVRLEPCPPTFAIPPCLITPSFLVPAPREILLHQMPIPRDAIEAWFGFLVEYRRRRATWHTH
jgi:hypothetical protein